MRHLGIDYGTRRVGLALSDDDGKMGFPHTVLPNNKELLPSITKLIREEKVGAVVFGESRALDGSKNILFEKVKAFAKEVEKKTGTPVVFEPEYYTTKQARDTQALAGKGSDRADAVAAAIILTSYLERHGNDR